VFAYSGKIIILSMMSSLSIKQKLLLGLPWLLILTMLPSFYFLTQLFSFEAGYLLSFLLYWIIWCILVPVFIINDQYEFFKLFKYSPKNRRFEWKRFFLLWWPLPFPFIFRFLTNISQLNFSLILASVILGVIIAFTEEILWRGLYVKFFPGNKLLGWIYPSLGFALWHICPLIVRTNPSFGGVFSFIIFAFLLGITWGYYAFITGSIRMTIIAHAFHDSLGLGGMTYIRFLQ
jgi:membrane protease YdiL (CAAX protease family)